VKKINLDLEAEKLYRKKKKKKVLVFLRATLLYFPPVFILRSFVNLKGLGETFLTSCCSMAENESKLPVLPTVLLSLRRKTSAAASPQNTVGSPRTQPLKQAAGMQKN